MNEVINKAIKLVGSQTKLAKLVGVSQPTVWCWLHNKKKVSPEKVIPLVKATDGHIQAHQIRPDLESLFPEPNK